MKSMNGRADVERHVIAAPSYRIGVKLLLLVGLFTVYGIIVLISADRLGFFSTNKLSLLHDELLIRYRNGFRRDKLGRQSEAVHLENVASAETISPHMKSKAELNDTQNSATSVDLSNVASAETILSHMNSKTELIDTQDLATPGCDFTLGKWIKDGKKPLYSGKNCKKWLSGMWACRLMVLRPNFDFENYRWQPDTCDLPAFDANNFLSRMQNKVLAFVGDSIGRQQYQSLMCMLTGGNDDALVEDVSALFGLVKPRRAIRADGTAQRFIETNTTILYYWSASLCNIQSLNKTDPNAEFAMHLDQPAAFIQTYLERMDVLILNTGHHWNNGKMRTNKWVMHVNGERNTDDSLRSMNIARNFTVHKIIAWLDKQILNNHTRAQIYMRSLSPRHFFNGDWDSGGTCDDNSVPVEKKNITGQVIEDPAVESAVLGTRVHLLNVTYLSRFRDEAHISKYRSRESGQDCLHWCLPGVPDVWNEVLYAELFFGNDSDRISSTALAR